MPCSGCSALHGVNPNLKKCVSFGQLAGKKDPKMWKHEQGHFERNLNLQFNDLHSTQLANIGPQDVPRTFPLTSPGRPLKILFDRPGDVLIWRPGNVLIWRPGDVLIWRSRDVPGRLIRDVLRTVKYVPLRTFRVLKLGCLKFFFNFSFRTYSIDQI